MNTWYFRKINVSEYIDRSSSLKDEHFGKLKKNKTLLRRIREWVISRNVTQTFTESSDGNNLEKIIDIFDYTNINWNLSITIYIFLYFYLFSITWIVKIIEFNSYCIYLGLETTCVNNRNKMKRFSQSIGILTTCSYTIHNSLNHYKWKKYYNQRRKLTS